MVLAKKKQEGVILPAMMGPMAASLIAPMTSSLIQPIASSLINSVTEKRTRRWVFSTVNTTFNDGIIGKRS